VIYGNGKQSRDFVYIDDVVEAIVRAAEKNVLGIVNVGSGKAYTFNEVIDHINQSLTKSIKPIYVEKPVNYLEKTLADTRKMKETLGVSPADLKEGLRKYLHIMMQSTISSRER
jgi:UDP-glucose 4-epimerase